MTITHIAFDLDGVLFTAAGFIEGCYADALKLSGLKKEAPKAERIIKNFGKPGVDILRDLFGELSEEEQTHYRKHLIDLIVERIREGQGEIFEGIETALKELKNNYTLAVCSNGNENYVNTVLECRNIRHYFIPLHTLTNTGSKNKTELLKSYLDATGTAPQNWILVGDRDADLLAAKNNGCYFIGCNWGFADANELAGSDIIIDKPEDIPAAVGMLKALKN